MENASKALLMAGSILLAIMIISVGALAYTRIREIKTGEEEVALQEQIVEFNSGYTSFNRKLIYGIDVIAACNKAIDNNYKQEANETDPWYISINITFNDNYYGKVEMINKLTNNRTILNNEKAKKIYADNGYKYIEISKKTYKLLQDPTSNKGKMDETLLEVMNDESSQQSIIKDTNDKNIEYILYTPKQSFKSKVFECTGIKHNGDGRIIEMNFTEKE